MLIYVFPIVSPPHSIYLLILLFIYTHTNHDLTRTIIINEHLICLPPARLPQRRLLLRSAVIRSSTDWDRQPRPYSIAAAAAAVASADAAANTTAVPRTIADAAERPACSAVDGGATVDAAAAWIVPARWRSSVGPAST